MLTVAVLGDPRVGKSSIVACLRNLPFTEAYEPTVEDSHVVELGGEFVDIVDASGDFKGMYVNYYHAANAFALVCSPDVPQSYACATHMLNEVGALRGERFPLVVLVNKADLHLTPLQPFPRPTFVCSARDGTRVHEAFLHLLNQIHPSKRCQLM